MSDDAVIARVDRRAMYARLEKLLTEVDNLLTSEDQRAVINSARRRLTGKLTVALIGRVSSGKSTLLNALVGDKVAMTDAGECTRVATLYTFWPQARTEIVGLDGRRDTLAGALHSDLGRPSREVDYAIVYWHSQVLECDYRVIDTPGISGGFLDTTAQQSTERAIIGFSSGLPKADVTLFMASFSGPRTDELDFLRAMGANRHNTIFLLQKSDMVGPGGLSDEDPFELAAAKAERLASEFSALTTTVIPVSAKLAEAAALGVNERDAKALAELADYEAVELPFLLQDGDGDSDRLAVVRRLVEQLGEFGLNHGRSHAVGGAVALDDWLRQRSGLIDVREAIDHRFVRCGSTMKALGVLNEIRRIAPHSPERRRIVDALDSAETSQELHVVRELAALDMMISWRNAHPLVAELEHVCMAKTLPEMLRLPNAAPLEELEHVAQQRQAESQARKLSAIAAPERHAVAVLERSYHLALRKLRALSASNQQCPPSKDQR